MMLRFVREVYGPGSVHEAWDEFTLWESDDPQFDPDTPHLEVFLPWLFHHWAPDPADTAIEDPLLHDRSPSSVLIERKGRRLDPVLRRYLEACVDAPFSFHEVLDCDPGKAMRTRDLLMGAEHQVLERSASRTLQAGDTFYGQLVSTDGITVIEACGLAAIPPREKLSLIDFREGIASGRPLSTESLREWDSEVREVYLDLMDRLMNPPMPRLQNTDGEEIVFHRLLFGIDSPQRALDGLKDLALDETEDGLLEEAEFDADGEVRRVTFAWKVAGNPLHKSWENTVHGNIEIDGQELRADVNSAERAARLRRILEERLGEGVWHKQTVNETVDDARSNQRAASPESGTGERPSWTDSPEARNRIEEIVAAHYEGWISDAIPALGGLTPLEAVGDPVGRERVEALMSGMERDGRLMDPPVVERVFAVMRERLGLVQPSKPEG